MFKVKLLVAIILLGVLTSCSTTKTPTEQEQRKVKTAKINAQLGIAYLEQNNIQRAKQKLMLALDQAPNIPETWYSLAYFFEATGNKDEARQYYLKALAVAPTRGDAQNNYGTFLCRSGEYDASIKQFLAAVKDRAYLDPADAYENAGLCALKIPDNERASHYFQQALSEDPSRPISIIKLAELDYKGGNYKNSEKLLAQYLDISEPNEHSERLGKLLVLKAHSTGPTETPITVAEKKNIESVDKLNKVVAERNEPEAKAKVLKPKLSRTLAMKPKSKAVASHPTLAKVKSKSKSHKLLALKQTANKKKHKRSMVAVKKSTKKIHSRVA